MTLIQILRYVLILKSIKGIVINTNKLFKFMAYMMYSFIFQRKDLKICFQIIENFQFLHNKLYSYFT